MTILYIKSDAGNIECRTFNTITEAQAQLKEDFIKTTGYTNLDEEIERDGYIHARNPYEDATFDDDCATFHDQDGWDYGWKIEFIDEKGELIR